MSRATSSRKERKRTASESFALSASASNVEGAQEVPEWLIGVTPQRSPYVPQMGDEVVYYRQGHEAYVKEVEKRKLYDILEIVRESLPFVVNLELKVAIVGRVVGIKVEILPTTTTRILSVRLEETDWASGVGTGTIYKVCYHDMSIVPDFLILRQIHDKGVNRHNWKPGDRFRTLFRSSMLYGIVECVEPLDAAVPTSKYACCKVYFNKSGSIERLSPWDMDIVPVDFKKHRIGETAVTGDDLQHWVYQSVPADWPGMTMDQVEKIAEQFECVLKLQIANKLPISGNLSTHPDYAHCVAVPITLSTIKSRLENKFYRRAEGLTSDLNYIVANAEQLNLGQASVKDAKIVRDICMELSRCPVFRNVWSIFRRIEQKYDGNEILTVNEGGPESSAGSKLLLKSASDQSEKGMSRKTTMLNAQSTPTNSPKIAVNEEQSVGVGTTPTTPKRFRLDKVNNAETEFAQGKKLPRPPELVAVQSEPFVEYPKDNGDERITVMRQNQNVLQPHQRPSSIDQSQPVGVVKLGFYSGQGVNGRPQFQYRPVHPRMLHFAQRSVGSAVHRCSTLCRAPVNFTSPNWNQYPGHFWQIPPALIPRPNFFPAPGARRIQLKSFYENVPGRTEDSVITLSSDSSSDSEPGHEDKKDLSPSKKKSIRRLPSGSLHSPSSSSSFRSWPTDMPSCSEEAVAAASSEPPRDNLTPAAPISVKRESTIEKRVDQLRPSPDKGSPSEEEFNDGYNSDYMGDDDDVKRLSQMTAEEREHVFMDRIEKRKILKSRLRLRQELRKALKKIRDSTSDDASKKKS